MGEHRLGDVIDDFCIKCRRLTNHAIVSIVDRAAAKVRCRTCYSDHDYRNELAPPSKKDLKKAAELLASASQTPQIEQESVEEGAADPDPAAPIAAKKKKSAPAAEG